MYSITSSTNRVLLLSIRVPFISFSSLIAIARTSKTMLNNSGENGYPSLVPDLRGIAFSFSPLRIILLWAYYILPLLYWSRFLLCPFFTHLYHKWVLNLVKGFFFIYWDDYMAFIFQFVNMVYHIDLCILKNPCISGTNPNWSWYMSILMCCWILFTKILLRIFALMFTGDIGL